MDLNGAASGLDWDAAGSVADKVDPALFWAERTGFRHVAGRGEGRLRAAIELTDAALGPAFLAAADQPCALGFSIEIAKHHRERLAAGRTCFVTGGVALDGLASSGWLAQVRRLQFGLVGAGGSSAPRAAADSRRAADRRPGRHDKGGPPATLAAPSSPAATAAEPPAPSTEPLIGIVDFGCAFAHPRFSRVDANGATTTRVLALWDQGRPATAAAGWRPQTELGYGREIDRAGLQALMAGAGVDGTAASLRRSACEAACYAAAGLGELLEGDPPRSHGTAVMDIAAGRRDAPADAAAGADLLFVQLPRAVFEDLNGGWLAVYLLDALAWLERRAGGRPLVVNVSLGTFAGPHDGESLLEAALDDFCERTGATLVLAAGNTVGRAMHASVALPSGRSAAFDWLVPMDDETPNFLELWYCGEHDRPPALRITLSHPDLPRALELGAAGARVATLQAFAGNEVVVAGLLHRPDAAAGGRHGMARVCVGPTAHLRADGAAQWRPAPSGRWRIELENRSGGAVTAHAWVERDQPGRGMLPDSIQSFVEPVAGWQISDECTLSGQACGRRPVVVGAYRIATPPQLARDTAFGPARLGSRRGPDLTAPGAREVDGVEQGLPVAANLGHEQTAAVGTSLAAPIAARWLFNRIAAAMPPFRAPEAPAPVDPQWGGFTLLP